MSAAVGVEPVDRLHERDARDLEEVLPRAAAPVEAIGDVSRERQVALHERLAQPRVRAPVVALEHPVLGGDGEGWGSRMAHGDNPRVRLEASAVRATVGARTGARPPTDRRPPAPPGVEGAPTGLRSR